MKNLFNTVLNAIVIIIGIILFPIYSISYALSKALKIAGWEDMETPTEWISLIFE